MKLVDIFKLNKDIKSYSYPVKKIVISIILVAVCFSVYFNIPIENPILYWIIKIIVLAFLIANIWIVYNSFGEMVLLQERKEKMEITVAKAIKNSKNYSIDDIMVLINENDIIEFITVLNDRIVSLGASSDLKHGSSIFFDKRYYIDSEQFDNYDIFEKNIYELFKDKNVCVYSIDGIRVNK